MINDIEEMIEIHEQNYNETTMILKGIFAGFFWTFGNVVFDIPVIYYDNVLIIYLYSFVISLIYFFILKSRSKSQTVSSWLVSLIIAVISWILLRFSPFNDVVFKFANQNYWNELEQTYDNSGVGWNVIGNSYIYYSSTALAVILSIVFSKSGNSK